MGPNDRGTPRAFFEACEHRWGPFDVDVCAHADNAKVARYWTIKDDGLTQDWSGLKCWMNPPYSEKNDNGRPNGCIDKWLAKAVEAVKHGAVVVALLPNDPSTEWFRYIEDHAAECWWLLGPRLRFEGTDSKGKPLGSPSFTNLVAVFRRWDKEQQRRGGLWRWRNNGKYSD